MFYKATMYIHAIPLIKLNKIEKEKYKMHTITHQTVCLLWQIC